VAGDQEGDALGPDVVVGQSLAGLLVDPVSIRPSTSVVSAASPCARRSTMSRSTRSFMNASSSSRWRSARTFSRVWMGSWLARAWDSASVRSMASTNGCWLSR
jgi:hypothetical protein